MNSSNKPGRNDPCSCGSGKKYKACCAQAEDKFSHRPRPDQEVWQRQARRAVAGGEFAEAEHWFRHWHSAKPNDLQALAGLGQSLCWQGRRREGIGYLLHSARLLERQLAKTGDPRFALELSGQMLHWGEAVPAERLARLAVRLAPGSAAALNNLALCLSRVNRDGEALPVARRVCGMLPEDPGCNILLATLEARSGEREVALARLRRVIALDRDSEQTARAWLEAGVVLDKMGNYDEAFEAFSRSAELRLQSPRFAEMDRNRLFDAITRNREGFDGQLLRRWPAQAVAGDGLPAPAFLTGFLRSGTTLTEQVLGAHPEVLVTDESGLVQELNLELQRISGVAGDPAGAIRALELDQLRRLRQFFWRRIREEYGEEALRKRLVDKNALNTIELGVIGTVFPEAKVLFALRDPRDVCLSCFSQAFAAAPTTVNLLSWQGIARQYAAVMGYWLAIRDAMQPAWLELRYEDAVADFEAAYRRVFGFLGLDWRPEVSRFHERAQGRYISTPSFAAVAQPIYTTSTARWKRYEQQLEPIRPLLQPFIETFGYGG